MQFNKEEKEMTMTALQTEIARLSRAAKASTDQIIRDHYTNRAHQVSMVLGRLSNEVAK